MQAVYLLFAVVLVVSTMMPILQAFVNVDIPMNIGDIYLADLPTMINALDNDRLVEIIRETVDNLSTQSGEEESVDGIRVQDLEFFSKLQLSRSKATAMEVSVDGKATITSDAVGVPALPTIAPKTGLSASCSNKVCDFVYRALTCQGMSVKIAHQCASHLVGAMYQCGNYPNNLYDAPSICADQLKSFLTTLLTTFFVGGKTAAIKLLSAFLQDPNFEYATCGTRCYNYYAQAANSLYLQCSPELQALNKTYPFVYGVATFNQFRMQNCNTNSTGNNCYVNFVRMQNEAKNAAVPVNTFNYQCKNYIAGLEAFDSYVMDQIYQKFSHYLGGCCFSTALQLSQQNQMNTSNLIVWPPCLLTYFQSRGVKLQTLCADHSMASQTTIPVAMHVRGVSLPTLNVTFSPYEKSSILVLMGTITGVLVKLNPAFGLQPYNFNVDYPFQVMVTNGTVSADGTSADFGLLFTVQNLDATQATTLLSTLKSALFQAYMAAQLHATTVTVTSVDASEPYILAPASGLIAPRDNAGMSMTVSSMWSVFTVCVTIAASAFLAVAGSL